MVAEPKRRDTFPVIALACLYLEKEKLCSSDEVVVVMPSDPYTDEGYFRIIKQMSEAVKQDVAELVLMGIQPTYASTKYGYIGPRSRVGSTLQMERFTEKPDENKAKELIDGSALWNGSVFVFRLGYLLVIARKYVQADSFKEAVNEVAEKAESVAVVPFAGIWKDLGTWDALSEVLGVKAAGNMLLDKNSRNTHVVNRLDLPCVCVEGGGNLIVAASPDGILVADKDVANTSNHI